MRGQTADHLRSRGPNTSRSRDIVHRVFPVALCHGSILTVSANRVEELDSIRAALESGERPVAVLGLPGVGKTHLLRRVVRVWTGRAFVGDLYGVTTESRLVEAIASAVGLELEASSPSAWGTVDRLGYALASMPPSLVVLDSVEAVPRPALASVANWLQTTGRSKLLLASQLELDELDATEFWLGPLESAPACEVFLRRAELVLGEPPSSLLRELAPRFARVLDGNPQLLELAAGRLAVLPAQNLLTRLEIGLASLRDTEGHRRSLSRALDRFWNLTSEAEQTALVCLSTFPHGVHLPAAEHVLAENGDSSPLETLQRLVEKALLQQATLSVQGHQLRLPRLLREEVARHASERDAALRRAQNAHAAYITQRGEAAAAQLMDGHGGAGALSELRFLRDDLVAVVRRGAAGSVDRHTALRAALALSQAYDRGVCDVAMLEIAETALSLADPGQQAAAQLFHAKALRASDPASAEQLLVRLGSDAEASPEIRTSAWIAVASIRVLLARSHRAADAAMHASGLANAARRPDLAAEAAAFLAHARAFDGDLCEAVARFESAIDAARASANRRAEALALANLGHRYLYAGEFRAAEACLRGARKLQEQVADRVRVAAADWLLSQVLLEIGDDLAAALVHATAAVSYFAISGGFAREAAARFALGQTLHLAGRLAEAEDEYERSAALIAGKELTPYDAELHRLIGFLRLEERRPAEAGWHFERAVELSRAVPSPLDESASLLGCALLAVVSGFPDRALETLGKLPSPHAAWVRHGAAVIEAAAQGHRAIDLGVAEGSLARLARRILDSLGPSSRASLSLVLDVSTAEVRLADGAVVSLRRRRAPWRILLALADAHDTRPGEPLSTTELILSGWPDERMRAESGATRLYFAINQLRTLGLRQLVLTSGSGYMLDARVKIIRNRD